MPRPLPAHSIGRRALLQMRQNGLDRVRIGDICDHPQPIEAISTVNFRIHPRDTVQSIEAHVSKVVAAEGISVRSRGGRNASGVSKWDADGYQQIKRSLQEIYGDVIVTPGLMIAGSDSRHYGKVADDAYRFNPFTLTPDSLTGFHGTNENISVTNFETGVKAYVQIIRNGSDH